MAEQGINGSQKESRKNNLFVSILINVFWVAGAIALIVGSFWISFLFGRRILIPIKRANPPEVVKKISIPVIEETKEAVSEKKKITVPFIHKEIKAKDKLKDKIALGKLYRVQIAKIFKKDEAINLMKDLQAKEFDVFAKNLYNEDWIVQIGAFKDKVKALNVIRELKLKGINNKVIIKEEN